MIYSNFQNKKLSALGKGYRGKGRATVKNIIANAENPFGNYHRGNGFIARKGMTANAGNGGVPQRIGVGDYHLGIGFFEKIRFSHTFLWEKCGDKQELGIYTKGTKNKRRQYI